MFIHNAKVAKHKIKHKNIHKNIKMHKSYKRKSHSTVKDSYTEVTFQIVLK